MIFEWLLADVNQKFVTCVLCLWPVKLPSKVMDIGLRLLLSFGKLLLLVIRSGWDQVTTVMFANPI